MGKDNALKTTFLINKPQKDGRTALCTATAEEWLAAVSSNRNLPTERRRYFIADCIEDGKEIDRMVIEVDYDEYRRWNSRHTVTERSRKAEKEYQFLSLDAVLNEADDITLLECLSSMEDMEAAVISEMIMDELKKQLFAWKPWAADLLAYYLAGKKKSCTAAMAKKYGVSEQVIRKYKRQFENFVKNFFAGVSF